MFFSHLHGKKWHLFESSFQDFCGKKASLNVQGGDFRTETRSIMMYVFQVFSI